MGNFEPCSKNIPQLWHAMYTDCDMSYLAWERRLKRSFNFELVLHSWPGRRHKLHLPSDKINGSWLFCTNWTYEVAVYHGWEKSAIWIHKISGIILPSLDCMDDGLQLCALSWTTMNLILQAFSVWQFHNSHHPFGHFKSPNDQSSCCDAYMRPPVSLGFDLQIE